MISAYFSNAKRRLHAWWGRDTLRSLAVTLLGCCLTGGVLYFIYVVRVLRCAQRSCTAPSSARTILLFGKRLENGRMDSDFQLRITRVKQLIAAGRVDCVVLLGGCSDHGRTEAEIARDELLAYGVAPTVELLIDDTSRNTLENLRNARMLLASRAKHTVALLSSRYHLERCAVLAQCLGFDFEVCAAEPHLLFQPKQVLQEAAYLCWIDTSRRWAYWMGDHRMMARIS